MKYFALVGIAAIMAGSALAETAYSSSTTDQALINADQAYERAVTSGDRKALAAVLDDEFTFTDVKGTTEGKEGFLKNLSASDATDTAALKSKTYGEVGLLSGESNRIFTGHVWVKRGANWRALAFQQAQLSDHPPSTAGSGATDCENPCRTVPYQPRNADEQGVITSWQELERAVTAHDSAKWAPHIADEFVLISSNNDQPFTKADRMAVLDKQKTSGSGSAPTPLVSAKMYDFPDAIVMKAEHQRGSNKAVHVTRIWIKRDGAWQMAFSEQTTEQ